MSSKSGGAAALRPLGRIGERAYLVDDANAPDFDSAFAGLVTRTLDLIVSERSFRAHLLSTSIEDLDGWLEADIAAFPGLCHLDDTDRSALVVSVFRLVAQSFGLRRDAVLRRSFDALLLGDDLPRGGIVVHAIDGIDTIVCELPSRLRLSEGAVVIAYDDQLALGSVETVASAIGDDRRLAVIDCARSLPAGQALLATGHGLIAAELTLRTAGDIAAFSGTASGRLPDIANLFAISDAEARAGLGALARQEKSSTQVLITSLGLNFTVTHAFSMDHGLFLSGWFADLDHLLEEVLVVDHGLEDPAVMEHWTLLPMRITIDDREQPIRQFNAFAPRRADTAAPTSLDIKLRLANGENHLIHLAVCRFDRLATRTGILDSAAGRIMPPATLAEVFVPAIEPIQASLNAEQCVAERVDYGTPSSRVVSLIIPLYRELRFIRSQLVAFSTDPFIRNHCQIVYSVDDPLIANAVRQMLSGVHNAFTLDIRVVFLARNGGYALANNVAADEADGETLVLMNSDIVPEAPGWLEPMLARLGQLPDHSVIGPKLVYADDSLQHAGMYFHHSATMGYWQNHHFYKGFGRDFPAANIERPVPAVTGALMLLKRQSFLAAGGFTADYIVGDYEDSDLCLKLRALGGTCLYMPSVALYHFERQSMPDSEELDAGSTIYNRALHSARWSDAIIEVMTPYADEVRHGL